MEAKLSFINSIAFSSGQQVQAHSHNYYEICFYGMGSSGIVVIDGIKYEFTAGDAAVIRKNTLHSESYSCDSKCRFFGFELEGENPLKNGIYHNLWNLELPINIIHKESINQDFGYERIISSKIEEILIYIQRTKSVPQSSIINITFLKNYIEENYMRKINVYDVAKRSGYSYSHFRHLFNRFFNTSPKQFLMDVRCQKAVDFLTNTEMNFSEIAYRCGFSDSGQMIEKFKQKYNMTPGAMKKSLKQ